MRITSSAVLSENNCYNEIPHLHFISIAATAKVGFGIFPNKMHLVSNLTAAAEARCCYICNCILSDVYISTTKSAIADLQFISRVATENMNVISATAFYYLTL